MATETKAQDFNRNLPNYKECPKLLVGQKALVTGANSGIGEAVAIGLARAHLDAGQLSDHREPLQVCVVLRR